MKKFLLQKNTLFITYGSLFYNGEIPKDYTTEQIIELLSEWMKEPESQETEDRIKCILYPEYRDIKEQNQKTSEVVEILTEKPLTIPISKDVVDYYDNVDVSEEFIVVDNNLYLKGIGLPIPVVLAEKMAKCVKENDPYLRALINFWKWTSLNPDKDSREDIYKWVKKQNIPILDSGLILTFRRVVKVSGSDINYDLKEFVDKEYNRLRKSKKSTQVIVYSNETENGIEYNTKYGITVGVLKDLYNQQLENCEVYYTDNHTHSEKYVIGVENRMERSKVDSNKNNACSTG